MKTTKQSNGKGGGNPTGLSPRNMKADHNINTALMQRIAKIRAQSTMKRS
jgi:hypothetical protein